MLSPEQIAELRGEAGLSPTPPEQGTESILAARRSALGIPEVSEPKPSFISSLTGKAPDSTPGITAAMGGGSTGKNIASHVTEAFKHPIETTKGVLKGIPGQSAEITKGFEAFGKGALEMAGADTTGMGLDYAPLEEMTTPSNVAQETGYIGAGFIPAEKLVTATKPIVAEAVPVIKKGTEMLKSTLGKMKPSMGIKTDEEIMATTADKLSKLTSEQRARWSKLHTSKISELDTAEKEAAKLTKETATKEAKTKIASLKEEAKALDYEFTQKTVEEAQSLKPKVLEAMRKNSDEYRKLVDAEINPVRETYVDDDSIIASIKNKFPSDPYSPDPYKADRLIKEMGLTEGSTRKVGELYDAVKAEKASMSSGGRTGSKVFSSSDMNTTDKISVLSDALKENGVDLKNANEFWKNYAPMRDLIVKRINPFKHEGAESGAFNTFTNMVKNSLAKPDAKNANFIKATEDMLGVKIGNPETRAAFEKLSANQKKIIAAAVEKEAKIEAAEAAKIASGKTTLTAKKGVEASMSTAAQQVERKKRIVGTIGALIGTAGGGTVLYNQLFGH